MSSTNFSSVYPTLHKKLSAKTIARLFTPDTSDLAAVGIKSKGRTQESRLFLMALLKSSQYLCYIPKPHHIPLSIVRFIAKTLGASLTKQASFIRYSKSGTYRRHVKLVRSILGFKGDEIKARTQAIVFAQQASMTKTRFLDVLNATIESLICAHYELPALSVLEKMARQAVVAAKTAVFTLIYRKISPELKSKIDALFLSGSSDKKSNWQRLKESGDLFNKRALTDYFLSFDALGELIQQAPSLINVTAERKQQLISEALSLHSRDMRRIPAIKRYSLAIILIDYRWAQGLD